MRIPLPKWLLAKFTASPSKDSISISEVSLPPFQVARTALLFRTNQPAWAAILRGRQRLANRPGVASIQSRSAGATARRIGGQSSMR